jgi:ABC-type proline/glycine betaine transport system substrate-binding protein
MADDPEVTYELPVLDITAVIIAVIAVIIALMSLYLANQTRQNTGDTVTELQLSRQELVAIKVILAKISQQAGTTSSSNTLVTAALLSGLNDGTISIAT